MIPFQLNASHIAFMVPTFTEDDRAHFIHIVLNPNSGLDAYAVQEFHHSNKTGEYVSRDGDIYPVTSIMFGYLIEVPRRETLDILQWVNDEVGMDQGYLNAEDVFNDTVLPSDILFAGVAEGTDVNEEGEVDEQSKDVAMVALQFKRKHDPKVLWLADSRLIPIECMKRPGDNTAMAYAIQMDDGESAEEWIKQNLPALVKHTLILDDSTQEIYMHPDVAPEILQIN